jgi:selenocysteine lyase/cysteine desulfurase
MALNCAKTEIDKRCKNNEKSEAAIFEIPFGREAKSKLYALDPTFSFTNHGSFGACPKMILEKRFELQLELEKCADKWFRLTIHELWSKNVRSLADYLHVNERNIMLCENATEAINAVLKSIEFDKGGREAILANEYTYGAVLRTIDYVSKYRLDIADRIQVFKVKHHYPIETAQSVIDDFDNMSRQIIVDKRLRLRVAIIDHISSGNAMLYPIREINAVIRKWTKLESSNETLIIVDGAHSIGQIPIELDTYDCDYYVSNLHKWFLAPKGCCFLYIKDRERLSKNLEPNYISWGYQGSLEFNFCFRATSDKSSWFVIDDCIRFYETYLGGMSRIAAYNNEMLDRAIQMLTKAWDTELIKQPKELDAPFMRCIRMPTFKSLKQPTNEKEEDDIRNNLMEILIKKYKLVALLVYIQGELYTRITSYIYNEIEDYELLRDAVLELANM